MLRAPIGQCLSSLGQWLGLSCQAAAPTVSNPKHISLLLPATSVCYALVLDGVHVDYLVRRNIVRIKLYHEVRQ